MESKKMGKIQLEKLQETINRMFGTSEPKQNMRYRYFEDAGKNKYFWTTEPSIVEGKKRFISGVMRYYKTKKCLGIKREIYHAKRNKAKARAIKLYRKNQGVC